MEHPITIGISAVNLIVLLGLYRKMSIIIYQHGLMWSEFAQKKGLDATGKASSAGAD